MAIKLISSSDAESILGFYQANHWHHREWEPIREEGYHSIDAWRERLIQRENE